MANPALGRKYSCHTCGTKFYDLNRPDAKCPNCGALPQDAAPEITPKAARAAAKRARVVPTYEPKVEEEEAAFDDDDAGPAFEDDEAPFEEEEDAFKDDEEGGEEEPAAEEEET